ncbi:hypothetical protein CR513_34760, partial [Mucuna pruriens]
MEGLIVASALCWDLIFRKGEVTAFRAGSLFRKPLGAKILPLRVTPLVLAMFVTFGAGSSFIVGVLGEDCRFPQHVLQKGPRSSLTDSGGVLPLLGQSSLSCTRFRLLLFPFYWCPLAPPLVAPHLSPTPFGGVANDPTMFATLAWNWQLLPYLFTTGTKAHRVLVVGSRRSQPALILLRGSELGMRGNFLSPVRRQPGENLVLGPDVVQQTTDKVRLIQERMRTAQSRQKSYADKRRKDLEFKEGDH